MPSVFESKRRLFWTVKRTRPSAMLMASYLIGVPGEPEFS